MSRTKNTRKSRNRATNISLNMSPKNDPGFPAAGRGKQKLKLEPQWGGRTLGEAWVESEGKRLQVSSADLVVESEGK